MRHPRQLDNWNTDRCTNDPMDRPSYVKRYDGAAKNCQDQLCHMVNTVSFYNSLLCHTHRLTWLSNNFDLFRYYKHQVAQLVRECFSFMSFFFNQNFLFRLKIIALVWSISCNISWQHYSKSNNDLFLKDDCLAFYKIKKNNFPDFSARVW